MQGEKEQLCQFTENMIHQMKTPLTALCLDLDLMEERLAFQEELPRTFAPQMEKKLATVRPSAAPSGEKQRTFWRRAAFLPEGGRWRLRRPTWTR